MTEIAQQVRTMIAEHTAYPLEKLRDETDLFQDVCIDGMDAWQLLDAFCSEFGVDRGAIIDCRHFGPEAGFNPFALLFPRWWAWHRNRIPITVGLLIEAATSKRWPVEYPDLPNNA